MMGGVEEDLNAFSRAVTRQRWFRSKDSWPYSMMRWSSPPCKISSHHEMSRHAHLPVLDRWYMAIFAPLPNDSLA